MGHRMTDEEFSQKQDELLERVPSEFHSALSYYAYEKGHAYGNEEILLELGDIVGALEEPVKRFAQRLSKHYEETLG